MQRSASVGMCVCFCRLNVIRRVWSNIVRSPPFSVSFISYKNYKLTIRKIFSFGQTHSLTHSLCSNHEYSCFAFRFRQLHLHMHKANCFFFLAKICLCVDEHDVPTLSILFSFCSSVYMTRCV